MATITLSSTHSTSISQTLAHENKTTSHLREASFSSYLSNSEEAFILKLGESMRKPSAIITTNPQEPLYQISFGRKKNEDGEISVFGAEKYFNGGMDHKEQPKITVTAKPQNQLIKEDDTVNTDVMKPRTTRLGTPSTCSEVSWNSQSALLPVPFRNPSPTGRFKVNNRNIFATVLGCRCYCLDKKSIDIEEIDGETKASMNYKKNIEGEVVNGKSIKRDMSSDPIGLVRIKQNPKQTWIKEEIPRKNLQEVDVNLLKEDCFTFPTSNPEVGNVSFKRQFEEEARRALEVIESPIVDKEEEEENIALSLEKKLSMLTWDATPRADQDTPPTPDKEELINNGDIESDSSSDLFEIKSFSSSAKQFFKRQPSDGMSGCVTPSSCYEPSEASIEWSVVTASAANFSVATDYDYPKPTDLKALSTTGKTNYTSAVASKATTRKDVPKRLPNMLSGCRSQKDVKVIGEAHKIPVKAKLQISDSFSQIEKFPADTKMKDFESAHVQHAFATQTFTQLRSDSLFIH